MDSPLIVFDFDGTIANSLEALVEIYNRHAARDGYGLVTPENRDALRGESARKIAKTLGVPLISIPALAKNILEEFRSAIPAVRPVPGMPETIAELAARGYRIDVLTSNREDLVREFLARNGIAAVGNVRGGIGLFGKRAAIKKAAAEAGVHPAGMVYLGDEVRDVEAARKAGTRVIAVAWGVNTRAALESAGPDAVAADPRELPDIIAKLAPLPVV